MIDLTRLRRELPDYDVATLPTIPAGWVDHTWRNEGCAAFQIGEAHGLMVLIDFPHRSDRNFPHINRFAVRYLEADGCYSVGDSSLFYSDDWSQVLRVVAAWSLIETAAMMPTPEATERLLLDALGRKTATDSAMRDLMKVTGGTWADSHDEDRVGATRLFFIAECRAMSDEPRDPKGGEFEPLDVIADAARDFGFALEGGGAVPPYLCRYTANRRAVTIGTEGPLEEADPLKPLFLIGGCEVDGDDLPAVGNRHPDPMPLGCALFLGREEARAMDSDPIPTMEGKTWRNQFPTFPHDAMPSLPPHWEDTSFASYRSPSFICYRAGPDDEADSLSIWIDFPDRSHRFNVSRLDAVGNEVAQVYFGEDWQAALRSIFAYALARPIQTRAQAESFIRALCDDGRSYHFEDDPRSIYDLRTGQNTFSEEEAEQVAARMAEIYALPDFTRDDCPIGVAMAYEAARGEEAPDMAPLDFLRLLGFSEDHQDWRLYDARGWHVVVSDADGSGEPTSDSFAVGLYDPEADCEELATMVIRSGESCGFMRAVVSAVQELSDD